MSLGLYRPMTVGIATLDPMVIVPMDLGIAAVALSLSRLVNYLFEHYHSLAYYCVIGLMLASTVVIVPLHYDSSQQGIAAVLAAAAGAARMAGYVCAPSILQQVIERCAGVLPDIRPYEENRKLLYESLKGMGYDCIYPDGAFYLFVKAPGGDDEAFCEKALDLNILVVPGVGFGAPGYMRISYCVDNAMIRRALPGFEKLIKGYK